MHSDPRSRFRTKRVRREPRDRLAEALQFLAGGEARIVSHREKGWASITFTGSLHLLELLFEGAPAIDAGETFIAAFPDYEFALPGQLVTDAAITVVDHRLDPPRLQVSVEVMLVERG